MGVLSGHGLDRLHRDDMVLDMSERRPTGRLHDANEVVASDWDTPTGMKRFVVKLAETQSDIVKKQSRRSAISMATLVITVCGFVGGLGATVAAFNQLGIFSMQSGWMFEGKAEAKEEHQKIHDRIDAMNTKLDDLPAKVAAEMRRKR